VLYYIYSNISWKRSDRIVTLNAVKGLTTEDSSLTLRMTIRLFYLILL